MNSATKMRSYSSYISNSEINFFHQEKKNVALNKHVVYPKQSYNYVEGSKSIKFDMEGFVGSTKKTDHAKEVARRFDFLDKSLEDEQDRQVYNFTKKLLLRLFKYITFDICPYIGVADSGQVIAEWHKNNGFKIARLIPLSQKEIVFQGIKDSGTMYAITTNLDNLHIQGNKELSPFLE